MPAASSSRRARVSSALSVTLRFARWLSPLGEIRNFTRERPHVHVPFPPRELGVALPDDVVARLSRRDKDTRVLTARSAARVYLVTYER